MGIDDIKNINADWLAKWWWRRQCRRGKHDHFMALGKDGNIHGLCWRCGDDVVMTSIDKAAAVELYLRLALRGEWVDAIKSEGPVNLYDATLDDEAEDELMGGGESE